ncbi:MAG: hypothetical protein J2P30_19480 [Actinobacteria bacterium]|nr:hypothetical protein [Actinomycetota bacterium]
MPPLAGVGVTGDDVQGVMIGVAPVVGAPRVVAASGNIMRAFGFAIAVADAELADAELADAELADAELADAELADAELADAELAAAADDGHSSPQSGAVHLVADEPQLPGIR